MYLVHGPLGVDGWFIIIEASSAMGARKKAREVVDFDDKTVTVRRLTKDKNDIWYAIL